MTRRRVWICVRAIAIGWAALLLITYLIERPLLRWTEPMLQGGWIPTAELALDCCAFAATGWVIGYFSRDAVPIALLAFAATLAWRDFTPLLPVNVPWLVRSVLNTFADSRYFAGFISRVAEKVLACAPPSQSGFRSTSSRTPTVMEGRPR